jgi:hypothetical protein
MARKPTAFHPGALELLKEFVQRKVNLPCTCFSHIQQLGENIRITTGEYLSLQTLSRFFGIISNGFNPSINTLDTLSRYTGFKAFTEIETIAENRLSKRQESNELFRVLSSLFASTEVSSGNEPGVFLMMENLCRLIHSDLAFGKLIYAHMARLSIGRACLFERLVYMDELAGVYGDALPICLLYAANREQKFFILNMFCYKSFLTNQKKLFNDYYQILVNYPQSEVMRFRPHIIDRYYAVHVLNEAFGNEYTPNGTTHLILPELDSFSSYPGHLPHLRFMLGEALLLTGQFEKAYEMLNAHLLPLDYKSSLDKAYYETSYTVYKLVSGYFSQQISARRASAACYRLLEGPLPLLAGDLLSLMLWSLLLALEPRPAEKKLCRDKIEALVNKTKFTMFHSFFHMSPKLSS